MARQEHGAPLGTEASDQLADLTDPRWVEPVGGLVEDQELGILQQGDPDPETLSHAERIAPHQIVAPLAKPDPFERRVDRATSDACRRGQHRRAPGGPTRPD